jgi:hypothetical protein
MKNKQIILTVAMSLFFAIQPQTTFAYTSNPSQGMAGSSASLRRDAQQPEKDNRAEFLRAYLLQYNSPLADEAETFVAEADNYNIDYRLLPAIAGVESWFGTRYPRNTYNGWGYGIYGTHMTYFKSWDDAIHTISKDIREKYMDKWGAKNVYEIGSRYASDPKWAIKVTHFISAMEAFEKKPQIKAISISL